MTREDFYQAFFTLTHGRLPLVLGRDRVYTSAEAVACLSDPSDSLSVVLGEDPDLHGTEMRLEWRVR